MLAPRRFGTRARTVAKFIALGAVANFAVAWALAAWLPQRGWTQRRAEVWDSKRNQPVMKYEFVTIGAVRQAWGTGDPLHYWASPFAGAIDTPKPTKFSLPLAKHLGGIRWGRTDDIGTTDHTSAWDGCEHATGWPLLTAWYAITPDPSGRVSFTIQGGFPLKSSAL